MTGILTLEALAGITTVAGTEAVELLLELRLIVKPPAGADDPAGNKFRVIFCVPVVGIDVLAGEKLRLLATCTALLSPIKPGAEAVMLAEP